MKSGGKSPLILDVRWKSVVNITPLVDLLPEKELGTHEEEAGGTQRRSGHFREEKILLPIPGLEPRTIYPVA